MALNNHCPMSRFISRNCPPIILNSKPIRFFQIALSLDLSPVPLDGDHDVSLVRNDPPGRIRPS